MCLTTQLGKPCKHERYAQLTINDFLDPSSSTLSLLWDVYPHSEDILSGSPAVEFLAYRLQFDPHKSKTPFTLRNVLDSFRGHEYARQSQLMIVFEKYAEAHNYFTLPGRPKKIKKGGKAFGMRKSVERATKLKEEGNEAFKRHEYHLAVKLYLEGLKALCPFASDLSVVGYEDLRQTGRVQVEFALAGNLARALIKTATTDVMPYVDLVTVCSVYFLSMDMHTAATKSEIVKMAQLHMSFMQAYPMPWDIWIYKPVQRIIKRHRNMAVGDDDWVHLLCCSRLWEIEAEALD